MSDTDFKLGFRDPQLQAQRKQMWKARLIRSLAFSFSARTHLARKRG